MPAVQRAATGSPAPRPGSPAGGSWTPPPGTFGETPAPLSLARPHVAAAAQGAPAVQRIVSDPSPARSAAPVVLTSAAAGLPSITATPVVQRVDGAAPSEAGQAGQSGRSDSELDQLASALFPRIKNHLRTEVIHEREARGLTFDAF